MKERNKRKERKERLQVFDHRQQQNSDVFRSDTLQSTKTEMFFKLKICSIRLPEDKQIKIKYTVFIWFLRRGGGAKERTSNKLKPHTLFSIYKNVVFPAQAKNYYFILLLG